MKWIISILFCVLLFGCEKEHVYGRLSYQTQDSTLLPLIVKINGTFVDSITRVGDWDCTHTDEWILLPNSGYWKVAVYGPDFDTLMNVYVREQDCKLINIKR